MKDAVPLAVIGGFLGAGKTTVVNHILTRPGSEGTVVLVNDFGSVSIDERLITSRQGRVIGLAGGCICCSYGSDLVGALRELSASEPAPSRVLVETSGVALPRVVASTAALTGAFLPGRVTVVVDAATLAAQSIDRFMGDTVLRQVREADTLVLNKTDLASAEALCVVHALLGRVNPGAARVTTVRGDIDLSLLFRPPDIAVGAAWQPQVPARARFVDISLAPRHAMRLDVLGQQLAAAWPRLLRAKGVLRDASGQWHALQVAQGRAEWQAREPGSAGEEAALVCIAGAGELTRHEVERWLEAARAG